MISITLGGFHRDSVINIQFTIHKVILSLVIPPFYNSKRFHGLPRCRDTIVFLNKGERVFKTNSHNLKLIRPLTKRTKIERRRIIPYMQQQYLQEFIFNVKFCKI